MTMFFLDRIVSVFNKFPERNAFCIQNKFYSYGDFQFITAQLQQVIKEKYPDEQRIGIVINDDLETYAAVIALLLSGKSYIPIHPHHPSDRMQQIILHSGIKNILSSSPYIPPNNVTVFNTCGNYDDNSPLLAIIDNSIDPTCFAYILFTSGSTGIPKGVPISYHNLNAFVNAFMALNYSIDETDRFLQMFDLTFDLSVMSFLIPLCVGACVFTIADKGAKFTNVYEVLENHNITFALMVPSIINYLRPYFEEIHLPQLKYSLFCGEALYKDVVTEWANCIPNAIIENVYGPTEATIFCLTYNINVNMPPEEYNGIVSIGKAMHGMSAVTVDEHNTILPHGTKGELCLSGEQLTPGYLNKEKTKEAFFEVYGKIYYRTGDIAYENEAGNFMYCGRIDHQVKIQGFRVELSEIEFHLRDISGSGNVVALAITNPNGLNQIDIVFESEKIDIDLVLEKLKTKIPGYMMPSRTHFITPFPLNSNGKTDRKQLEKIILESI